MRSPFLPHSALKLQGKINRMMRKLQVSVLLVSCIVAICAIFVQPKSAHACLVAPCPYKFRTYATVTRDRHPVTRLKS